ncbi:hypothetical protein OLEAN_C14950 [Oleispira antarctica RB-8]|uniref:Uncharacterized protein n=1 Tax=Oleispira antarctica RB-8 TaxID=698738 RepID=R4YLK9_OLEAN|nr:hypothetical protein OLEAN_C14950 [Oleispira antarctica RB-8]
MEHIIKKALCISLLFFSLAVRAESDVDSFTQFKISSLQLVSSFSSFIYFEGDKRNQLRLQQAKIKGDQALAQLMIPHSELTLKWQQISDYLDSSQGYQFDVNLEAGWSILQGELSQIINVYEAALVSDERASMQSNSDAKNISRLQVKMETILSRYMAFANSTLGGYGISSKGTPLEQQIQTVSAEMKELAALDIKYKPLANKWGYIDKTLLAYNSNVAPFVVMHTFEKMRKIIAAY